MYPNALLEEVAKARIRELHRRAERERLALTLRRRHEETAATLDASTVTSPLTSPHPNPQADQTAPGPRAARRQ